MTNTRITLPLARKPAAVYLLQRLDRRRFKLGWAVNPIQRLRSLPEYDAQQLDLEASRVLWLPSARRAWDLERAMHRTLAPFKTPASHRGDGHTEWFQGSATIPALELLSRFPHPPGERPALLVPLLVSPVAPEPVSLQDTWSAVEDVLLRLQVCTEVQVCSGEPLALRVKDFKVRVQGPLQDLRSAAMDTELYLCREGENLRPIARLIDYEGNDLLVILTPLNILRRWPGGGDVALQIQAFLARLPVGA
ncbi:GIY-YIG nuclease family protein [Roseateles violae]|uniref:GIY-YIG nuclease family protein n=1 Tax=Roseateles violae TaxID=3058042 RepID=A0ABT8E052_9BURK|nr:GIY-YIG nuclease family protein [Pelomonas sp. PFR6]MDN3923220.1 GIY-YIG nuclease family protein [Pelomonas sp. PFR6]